MERAFVLDATQFEFCDAHTGNAVKQLSNRFFCGNRRAERRKPSDSSAIRSEGLRRPARLDFRSVLFFNLKILYGVACMGVTEFELCRIQNKSTLHFDLTLDVVSTPICFPPSGNAVTEFILGKSSPGSPASLRDRKAESLLRKLLLRT